jgi:hypothetical protein
LAQEFGKKYPGLDYGKTIEEKIAQLQSEINRIQQSVPSSQLQPTLP